jgi:hypothetical protein
MNTAKQAAETMEYAIEKQDPVREWRVARLARLASGNWYGSRSRR